MWSQVSIGSITKNKLVEVIEFQLSYFKFWKMMLWKCCTQNARLDEAEDGIKITGRNVNNLRYADDTTLMAESEELKSLLMKVKEENEEVGL